MRRVFTVSLVMLGLLWAVVAPYAEAPGAEPSWEELRGFYDYDASMPLDAAEEEVMDRGAMTVRTVRFKSVNEEVVPATLCMPKNAEKAPVILFLHGLGGDRSNGATMPAPFMCPMGFAVLCIDAQYHGERKVEGKEIFSADLDTMVEGFRQSIIDNRRALDYVASREDLDSDRVVLIGASMGAMMGSIVAAVDERVRAAFLIVGGGDWLGLVKGSEIDAAKRVREALGGLEGHRSALAFVEPANFVGHIAPRPVQMLNGKDDKIVPAACAQALFDAARDPKSIVWYNGEGARQGHVPPLDVLFRELRGFLESQVLGRASGGG